MRTTKNAGSLGRHVLIGVVFFLVFGPVCIHSQAKWITDFEEALKQAYKEDKFIVLDISASW
jgi:Sec-independent protein translocase protein TatA